MKSVVLTFPTTLIPNSISFLIWASYGFFSLLQFRGMSKKGHLQQKKTHLRYYLLLEFASTSFSSDLTWPNHFYHFYHLLTLFRIMEAFPSPTQPGSLAQDTKFKDFAILQLNWFARQLAHTEFRTLHHWAIVRLNPDLVTVANCHGGCLANVYKGWPAKKETGKGKIWIYKSNFYQ